MKNHYKRLKVKLTVMIFVAAILGSLSLTLYKAIEIQDDYLTDMYNEYCTRADKAYRATLVLDQRKMIEQQVLIFTENYLMQDLIIILAFMQSLRI